MTNVKHGWVLSVLFFVYTNVVRNPVLCMRFFLWQGLMLIKFIGLSLVSAFMRKSAKRIMLITSLYQVIEKDKESIYDANRRLNEKLKLSNKLDVLAFPAMIASHLWDEESVIKCVTECDSKHSRASIEQLARLAPVCLLSGYESLDKLIKDIESVLALRRAEQVA